HHRLRISVPQAPRPDAPPTISRLGFRFARPGPRLLRRELGGHFVASEVEFGNWPHEVSHCRDQLGTGSQHYLYIGSSSAEIVTPGRKPTPGDETWRGGWGRIPRRGAGGGE